ncbi:MAG: F0F1 ATP synthase subunit alpha, partial [Candidatus Moranbacteria bacterium]|nr:F0F1 ATP synthase subunit alpha [Candidatus Moranbacteria bacterium]
MAGNMLIEELKKQILDFRFEAEKESIGRILETGDGVARLSGLSGVAASELISFDSGAVGVALNLEESEVGVMMLSGGNGIREGEIAKGT